MSDVAINIVCFVGPSLKVSHRPIHSGRTLLEYRPPARRGDLLEAAEEAGAIILIDGHMVNAYSPTVRECMEVLDADVALFGAASLGAMRAVELRDFGMHGAGWIYQRMLEGELENDDEFLSVMDPSNYQPLTEPLINYRKILHDMRESAVICGEVYNSIMDRLVKIHYTQRTSSAIFDVLNSYEAHIGDSVQSRLLQPNIKTIDAMSAIELAMRGTVESAC